MSWRQQWRQLSLVIFGLLCASGGLSSVLALNETANQKMSQLSTPFAGKPQAIATLSSDRSFSKKDYAYLLNQGWQVVGLYRFQLKTKTLSTDEHPISMVALDVSTLLTQLLLTRTETSADSSFSKSASATPSDETSALSFWQSPLVSTETLNWFSHNVDTSQWPLPMPVAVPAIKDGNVYISMTNAGTFQHTININELWIFSPVDKKQAKHLSDAGFDLQLVSSDTGTLTDSFYINITAMGLLMFAVSMFISLNAYNLLFSGRKDLIRQLYLMGVDTRELKILFTIECNLLTLLCCTLGFALGLALAQLISPGMEMTLRNLYDARFRDSNVSFFTVWVTVVACGTVAANLVLWFPVNRSLEGLNQIDSVGKTKNKSKHRPGYDILKRQSLPLSCSALIIMATWLLVFPAIVSQSNGLLISFLLITACVLCGCIIVLLLIPKVLELVKQNASPERALLFYYCSDAVRLSDKSRIAICAFFIAITANIGMNLMVGSFRQATDTWIHQQFVADYYLSTNEADKFQDWADRQQHLDVYHRAKAEVVFEGRKTQILPIPEDLKGHYPLLFKSFMEPFNDNEVGEKINYNASKVFINEQMAIRHKLDVGATIQIKGQAQINQQNFIIAGIYYDYGNMFNQLLVAKNLLSQFRLDDSERQLFSITLKPGFNESNLQETSRLSLEKQLEELEVSYFSGDEIKDISMKVFEQTFLITSGLNLITLLVAGASLATSILIIERQNNHQTRILQQLGISGFKVWLGSLVQYGYLVTIVFILSVPFGILLSYQLINNINYTAFQWSYPLQHDLVSYVFVYAISLVTVLLAVSLMPVLKSLKKLKYLKAVVFTDNSVVDRVVNND